MEIQSIKGTEDVFGLQAKLYQKIEKEALLLADQLGCEFILLPILESLELFKRGVGENTDVVSKEMFSFQDRKERFLCLRPEGTAQTVRFVLEQGKLRDTLKRYIYLGSMFRAEKPQKGRQREFHQLGIEIIDEGDSLADIDVITYALSLLERLGIRDYVLQLNSVGCRKCRPAYIHLLLEYLEPNRHLLCKDCQFRMDKNPLRLFDCKNSLCQKILDVAPRITDHLCLECQIHFQEVLKGLDFLKISYQLNFKLVRGLDYYTKTTFEITLPHLLGSQDAVCGGGRYDYLFETLDPLSVVPAVGLAFGIERLIIALETQQENDITSHFDYIILCCSEARWEALKIQHFLREKNQKVVIDNTTRALNKKLKKADKLKASFIILMEIQEWESQLMRLKNMQTGEQSDILLNDFAHVIEGLL